MARTDSAGVALRTEPSGDLAADFDPGVFDPAVFDVGVFDVGATTTIGLAARMHLRDVATGGIVTDGLGRTSIADGRQAA